MALLAFAYSPFPMESKNHLPSWFLTSLELFYMEPYYI